MVPSLLTTTAAPGGPTEITTGALIVPRSLARTSTVTGVLIAVPATSLTASGGTVMVMVPVEHSGVIALSQPSTTNVSVPAKFVFGVYTTVPAGLITTEPFDGPDTAVVVSLTIWPGSGSLVGTLIVTGW